MFLSIFYINTLTLFIYFDYQSTISTSKHKVLDLVVAGNNDGDFRHWHSFYNFLILFFKSINHPGNRSQVSGNNIEIIGY